MTTPPSPATTATPGLPLFYGTPLPVRFPEHRNLGLRADGHYRFAAASPALPLTVPEFAAAGRVYPIVFAQDEAAMPLAVTGLAAGRNLFVSPDGAWRPGCYVPAYLRRYPFIGIEIEAGTPPLLGVDTTSDLISTDAVRDGAEPLFDAGGEATERTRSAMAFCEAYAAEHAATRDFARALTERGLLVARTAEVQLRATGSAPEAERSVLSGFQVVDEAAFRALPAEALGELHARGWLAAIVLHLASQLSWQVLLDTAGDAPAGLSA
ncbi:SapC family protein (plasmid) [Methylobacterium currus]|uniref:SapC family protein n=1 Tax=Methylobacterium currus TaxID=2051553 RepID=UPI001E553278|nr:SapC family protein [Methylobacterium currus]UHC20000.1 SapC family protein [Methylobacterium currus]